MHLLPHALSIAFVIQGGRDVTVYMQKAIEAEQLCVKVNSFSPQAADESVTNSRPAEVGRTEDIKITSSPAKPLTSEQVCSCLVPVHARLVQLLYTEDILCLPLALQPYKPPRLRILAHLCCCNCFSQLCTSLSWLTCCSLHAACQCKTLIRCVVYRRLMMAAAAVVAEVAVAAAAAAAAVTAMTTAAAKLPLLPPLACICHVLFGPQMQTPPLLTLLRSTMTQDARMSMQVLPLDACFTCLMMQA